VTVIADAPGQFWSSEEMTARRFPPPWSLEELDSCFVVTDGTRQKLAYVHFEDDPERRSAAKLLTAAKLLSRVEALRIAGQLCEAAAADFNGRDLFGL
jgi:hypothetical protein